MATVAQIGQAVAEVVIAPATLGAIDQISVEAGLQHVSEAEIGQLAVEVILPPPARRRFLPLMKRLDMISGLYDGARRRWDVRLHRQNAAGAWKRLPLPSEAIQSVTCVSVANGGMSDASADFAAEWAGASSLRAGDRLSVWMWLGAWQEIWRGSVNNVQTATGRPGTVTVSAAGPMADLNRIWVERQYALPDRDVAAMFARLVSDYLDPWRDARGLPRLRRDIHDTGEEAGTRSFEGGLADTLTELVQGVPGVVWGIDLDDQGNEVIFLYPRPTNTQYCVLLGKDTDAVGLDTEARELVNAIELVGAPSKFGNFIANGGFEKPTGDAVNLIANGSFEEAKGDDQLYPANWTRTGGEPSRKQARQDNVGAASGNYYAELDNTGEEFTSDFTSLVSDGTYELRCWMAREDSTAAVTPAFYLDIYDDAEVLLDTVTLTPKATDGSGETAPQTQAWKEYSAAFGFTGTDRKFKLRIKLTAGGGGDRGLAVDDVMLYDRAGITQEGWQLVVSGGADVQPSWDYSPGYQGAYCVRLDAATPGGSDSVALKPVSTFELREHQEVRFQVALRVSADATVRIGIETWNGSGWDDHGVDKALLAADGWNVQHYDFTAGGSIDQARAYVKIGTGQDTILDVDAAYLFEGHPADDRPFEDGEPNYTVWLTTDDAFAQTDTSLSAAVKASIATYGRREARVTAPKVRDLAGAQAYARNYFLQHAVPGTPGPVTVYDRMKRFTFDGLVRLANVPKGVILAPLFPVRIAHTFDVQGWRCALERDTERPNEPRLWDKLTTRVEDVYRANQAAVAALQTGQQRG